MYNRRGVWVLVYERTNPVRENAVVVASVNKRERKREKKKVIRGRTIYKTRTKIQCIQIKHMYDVYVVVEI